LKFLKITAEEKAFFLTKKMLPTKQASNSTMRETQGDSGICVGDCHSKI